MREYESESESLLKKMTDQQRCHANRTMAQLQAIRHFNIPTKEINQHLEWLYSRGGDPDRLARLGEIIADTGPSLQYTLHDKIKNNFLKIPDVEALEREIQHFANRASFCNFVSLLQQKALPKG